MGLRMGHPQLYLALGNILRGVLGAPSGSYIHRWPHKAAEREEADPGGPEENEGAIGPLIYVQIHRYFNNQICIISIPTQFVS